MSSSSQILAALKEARQKLEQSESQRNEPIAIIGAACRMPGGAETTRAFWDLLRRGEDPITDIPADRWDNSLYYDADPDAPGKINVSGGGFVRLAREFDAEFFGIAPREAVSLEPQQRLLLEVTWEAFEDATIPPDTLFGKEVGVFATVCWNDYGQRLLARPAGEIDAYMASGIASSMAAGRLAHIFGFQGPAIVIDTACSSSLVSIHVACQSLRSRECEVALVGAATQLISPEIYVNFSRSRMLSPDNRCKTFDAGANGFVRSEGAAALVLKRLSDAQSAGDHILAVVLGSAVNHDGHASGLTVPNGPAQQAVIRKALRNASVTPEDVSFVEAHGTGTSLGDPIEVGALSTVYGKAHSQERPLLLGSVKSNVGHLEVAAGITSVLKVVLALQHREVPPNLHFTRPSPHVPWSSLPFKVPTQPTAWNATGRRIAGVSSFGFSGTNAHLIVAEPLTNEMPASQGEQEQNVLVLSAKTERSLRQLAARYADFLRAQPTVSLSDLCFSAVVTRTHFVYRLAIVAVSVTQVTEALDAAARGEPHAATMTGRADRRQAATAHTNVEPGNPALEEQPLQPTRAAQLYVRGSNVNWGALYPPGSRRRVPLPHYAFDRKPYWIEARRDVPRSHQPTHSSHPLLGARLPVAAELVIHEAIVSSASPAFLADHQIGGRTLMPAAAFVEMAMAAGREQWPANRAIALEDVVFHAPLELPGAELRRVQCVLAPLADGSTSFRISVCEIDANASSSGEWQLCASGTLRADTETMGGGWLAEVARMRTGGATIAHVPGAKYYESLDERGATFASAFRAVRDLWREGRQAIGEVVVPDDLDLRGYGWHPSLLDACMQVVGAVAPEQGVGTFVPMSIERLTMQSPNGRKLFSRVTLRDDSADSIRADCSVIDAAGEPVANINGLVMRRLAPAVRDTHVYTPAWRRFQIENVIPLDGRWLLIADRSGFADALASHMRAAGAESVVVRDLDGPEQLAQGGPLCGIVHCAALDARASFEMNADDLLAEQPRATGTALQLGQTLARAAQPVADRLYLLTEGAQSVGEGAPSERGLVQSPMLGFARVLARELPGVRCLRVDLDGAADRESQILALLAEMRAGTPEDEVALRAGERWVLRLARVGELAPKVASATTLVAREPGLLDTLQYVPAERRAPAAHEIEIAVCATGLGFRDVLGALGMYPGSPQPFGVECSGVVTAVGVGVKQHRVGDAVFGTAFGCFGSHAIAHAECVVKKPPALSHELAAALPSSFLTAHYALEMLGELRAGQRVLIHAGAGGVGQIAIQIALAAGAEVFATAGSGAKRALLKQQGVHHVMDSRTLNFADEVRRLTNGLGVDCVLNSLAEPFLSATFDILADDGCFLEIGKRGILDPSEAARRKPRARYNIVDLAEVGERNPDVVRQMLETLVARVATGRLRAPNLTVFPAARAADAFRYMAQARHIGKIVVSLGSAESSDGLRVVPRATYLITGGLGEIGLTVANHLASRGAHTLVLVGRRGPTAAARERIAEIERSGALVRIRACDVARYDDLAAVLSEIEREGPELRGVIHAAGTLDDGALLQQDWQRFAGVFAPKVAGTWNLHRLITALPLDWFVLFGAASAVLGERGQSNYAAANAFLDAFAAWRRRAGLPALSIDWGPWREAGMAARPDIAKKFAERGVLSLSSADALSALDRVQSLQAAQAVVLQMDWRRYFTRSADERRPALLAEIAAAEGLGKPSEPARASAVSARKLVAELENAPPALRSKALLRFVEQQICKAIGLDAGHPIDPQQPLQELGLDSLMAVELRNSIASATGCSLPATFAFDYPVAQALADRLGEMLGLDAAAKRVSSANARPTLATMSSIAPAYPSASAKDIAELNDAEATELLLKELEELRSGS